MTRKRANILYVLLFVFTILASQPALAGGDKAAAKLAWPMIESGVLLVDVRTAKEFNGGHVDGAINIEWDDFDALTATIGEDKQRPVVFYCKSGNRAGKSITALATKGYTNIYNATGFDALRATMPEHQ